MIQALAKSGLLSPFWGIREGRWEGVGQGAHENVFNKESVFKAIGIVIKAFFEV